MCSAFWHDRGDDVQQRGLNQTCTGSGEGNHMVQSLLDALRQSGDFRRNLRSWSSRDHMTMITWRDDRELFCTETAVWPFRRVAGWPGIYHVTHLKAACVFVWRDPLLHPNWRTLLPGCLGPAPSAASTLSWGSEWLSDRSAWLPPLLTAGTTTKRDSWHKVKLIIPPYLRTCLRQSFCLLWE